VSFLSPGNKVLGLLGLLIGAAQLTAADSTSAGQLRIEFRGVTGGDTPLHLRGKDAHQQLLATTSTLGGIAQDATRQVNWSVSPAHVATIDTSGRVTPLADGEAIVTAKGTDGTIARLPLSVGQVSNSTPISFPNRIVPLFTKAGCNAGGCHGKAGGQNGFRLSLLGFEPTEDYEHLLKEARGRRIFPASPANSLLLLKGTALLPHGGGKRLDTRSEDYQLIVRWIEQGMPYGRPSDPTLARIEVFPPERIMSRGSEQQLAVTAHYTDGSTEDVTRGALFESNDKELALVDESGLVTVADRPGDVAVMIRYQTEVAVFRAMVPLGAPVAELPAPRNFIDELVFQKLRKMGIPPSDECDDPTFIRRVTLDIAGRLPTPGETSSFLADTSPKKRPQLIDRLLDSGDYADYFANKWSALLRNKRTEARHARGAYGFHDWIRESLLANKPFSRLVREILTATGEMTENPPVAWYRQAREPQTQLEDTAQLFLGQRLQCAQCHHHPYEKWSQQDYYSLAAFFSQVGRKPGSQPGEDSIYTRRAVPSAINKKTKQPVKPAGLGSAVVEVAPEADARVVLADWITAPTNSFFARSLVNRYWKHFFNRGIVDPEDDMRETNPPANPELLDALAGHFLESGTDLKDLIRTICQSRVYQFSSTPNAANQIDKQNFSRYYPKRLTAEVLYDAVDQVTHAEPKFEGLPAGIRAVSLPDNSFNAGSYFLTVFGRPDSSSACECERSQDASLAQSLHLLNSRTIQEKLSSGRGRAAMLAADKEHTVSQKVRDLYLWAYSRPPRPDELALAASHLAGESDNERSKDASAPRRERFEDIIWALINTKEFLFNH